MHASPKGTEIIASVETRRANGAESATLKGSDDRHPAPLQGADAIGYSTRRVSTDAIKSVAFSDKIATLFSLDFDLI